MKKNKIIISLGTMLLSFSVPCFSQLFVHDSVNNIPIVSQWLTAIDSLYSNYDMVMNTITNIENQWKQINQAIENMKGIDWENVKFDGDFDIRDDIKNANKRVNRLLSQANAIKATLNSPIVDLGDGATYSLADFCGLGDEGKNFGSAVKDIYGHMKLNVLEAARAAVGNLTEEQEKAIWQKYGISPQNYYLVAQTSKLIKSASSKCLGKVTQEAKDFIREQQAKMLDPIIDAVLKQKTSDGTIPEGALAEANLLLQKMIIEENGSLKESVNEVGALIAQKLIADEQQKDIDASEKQSKQVTNNVNDANQPSSFVAGHTKSAK